MIKSKETVILFGTDTDPEVKESVKKITKAGRKVEVTPRPRFDTGIGPCGKHLCGCKGICLQEYSELEKQFGS